MSRAKGTPPDRAGPLSDWITTDEVAAMCGLNPVSVRRYAWRGAMPAPERKGRTLLFNRLEIEAWMSERRPRGRPRKV
jgi:predicted DNA-binding transcriptional regulator AlpA